MYSNDELVKRLLNGESIDDIAAEMTNILNTAKDEADKQKYETKMKEEANKARRDAAAQDLIDALEDYLVVSYPKFDWNALGFKTLTPKDINEFADGVMGYVQSYKAIADMFDLGFTTDPKDTPCYCSSGVKEVKKDKTPDEIINDFLRESKLLH